MLRLALLMLMLIPLAGPAVAQNLPAPPDAAAPPTATPTTAPAAAPPTTAPAVNPPAAARPRARVEGNVASLRTVEAAYGDDVRLLRLSIWPKPSQPGELTFERAGQKRAVAADQAVDVVLQTPPAGSQPIPEKAVAVLLVSGEWIVGAVADGDERTLSLWVAGLDRVAIALRNVRGIVTPLGAHQPLSQIARTLLADAPAPPAAAPTDVIRLANGETINGTVVKVDAKGLTVQGPLGDLNVALDVLTVAKLANPLPAPPSRKPPLAAWVQMVGGSRLLAEQLNLDEATLRFTRPGQADALTVSSQLVARVDVINGRWRWLDEQTPLVAAHQPFLSMVQPARSGSNVLGDPLRIGERLFHHGIGVHSGSRLVFDVGRARKFTCLAGVDASAGPLANVDIQVLVDGKVRLEKKGLTADGRAVPVEIDLAGAQKLELRVDYGANGNVQDRFNWADAALID